MGFVPNCWVRRFELENVPDSAALPTVQLDRRAVKSVCRSPAHPVLFGYVCVMAWGLQGKDSKTKNHVGHAWKERKAIKRKLEKLRSGGLTREDAYDLFCGKNKVKGLGPSYFTKLLYFFSPTPDFYIMDQWTGKSVNLLTGKRIVKISCNKNGKGSPTPQNNSKNFREFCEEVDHLAWLLGCTGEQIEERLFSRGSHPPVQWRAYVNKHCPPENQK